MENLELQTQIISLGKLLVQELGLNNSTDTFSRWMAHYIAEKMALAESLPLGKQKADAEKDSFNTILKLWEHRWVFPSGKRPFENFALIIKILERLNPEKEDSFYYSLTDYEQAEIEKNSTNPKEVKIYLDAVMQLDKVVRIWIYDLLQQVAFQAKNEKIIVYLKNASKISDNEDVKVIKTLLDNDPSVSIEGPENGGFDKKFIIEKLNRRINQLEKYTKLNDLLLESYKKELDSLLR